MANDFTDISESFDSNSKPSPDEEYINALIEFQKKGLDQIVAKINELNPIAVQLRQEVNNLEEKYINENQVNKDWLLKVFGMKAINRKRQIECLNLLSQIEFYKRDGHMRWTCSKCTTKNHPSLPNCEVCDTSRYC